MRVRGNGPTPPLCFFFARCRRGKAIRRVRVLFALLRSGICARLVLNFLFVASKYWSFCIFAEWNGLAAWDVSRKNMDAYLVENPSRDYVLSARCSPRFIRTKLCTTPLHLHRTPYAAVGFAPMAYNYFWLIKGKLSFINFALRLVHCVSIFF